jgi:hypothetical protein
MSPKQVNYESPEAASIQIVTGWLSSTGRFWGNNEHMARYDGSTHRVCKDNPEHGVHANNSWCKKCREERMDAKWNAMPRREYDGSPVCVFDSDRYFFDGDEIIDWLVERDIKPEDARLVFCKPRYASRIDPDDHFCDDLPEDGEVSAALQEAFDALNKVIAAEPPLSWWEGDVAVALPSDFLEQS